MKKCSQLLTICLFCCSLFGVALLNLLAPQRDFSSLENRYLAKLPTFTLTSLWKGTYIPKLETWFQDQFLARDTLVSIKALNDLAMGFQKTNNVYFGKNGYLIEQVAAMDPQRMEANIQALNRFAQSQEIPMSLIAVPSKYTILPYQLPTLHYNLPEEPLFSKLEAKLTPRIQYLDITATLLTHQQEPIYYKTDHHWTALGAYYAYEAYQKAMHSSVSFTRQPILVSDQFKGTLYAKSKAFWYGSDDIFIYTDPQQVQVETENSGLWHDGVYYWEHLQQQDAYRFFLDGNHAITRLRSEQANKRHILLIKDSFAHSFAPYLTYDASEITMLDLRYYKDSISSYIKDHKVDEVIFLYSMDSLTMQNDLSFLK